MLPKVATHLLGTTTRSAAAAVQNQTTLRNVLQLHPNPNPSTTTTNAGAPTHTALGPTAIGLAASSAATVSARSNTNSRGDSNGPSGSSKKDKAGRRFYTGYNSAARAVTQANALTSQDNSSSQLEEVEDVPRRPLLRRPRSPQKRVRLRSSSVTNLLPTPREKERDKALPAEKVSVLKTVQLQARSLHALAATAPNSEAHVSAQEQDLAVPPTSISSAPESVQVEETTTLSSPRPRISRRNSTSSIVSRPSSPLLPDPADIPLPPSPALSVRHHSSSAQNGSQEKPVESATKDATQQATTPSSPSTSSQSSLFGRESESSETSIDSSLSPKESASRTVRNTVHSKPILAALRAKDEDAVIEAVRALLALPQDVKPQPLTTDFNTALEALTATRKAGEPLQLILDVYDAIIKRSLSPSFRTYQYMIEAFTRRDWEVHRMIVSLESVVKTKNVEIEGQLRSQSQNGNEQRTIKRLKQEKNFPLAMKLFSALQSIDASDRLEYSTYKSLIRSAAIHENVKVAVKLFQSVEQHPEYQPDPDMYRYLIQAFTNSNDWKGAEMVFKGYRESAEQGKVHWYRERHANFKRQCLMLWNQMIEVYFRSSQPEKAIELLDLMLKANEEEQFDWVYADRPAAQVPMPASSTFTTIIGGFIQSKDVSTALAWFNRLLEQSEAPGTDPFVPSSSGRPMRPDQVAWTLILDTLASEGKVEELNKLYSRLLETVQQAKTSDEPVGTDGVKIFRSYRELVFVANIKRLQGGNVDFETAVSTLDFLRDKASPQQAAWNFEARQVTNILSEEYAKLGLFESGFVLLKDFVLLQLEVLSQNEGSIDTNGVVQELQNMVSVFWERTREALNTYELPYPVAIDLARLSTEVLGLKIGEAQAAWLLHAYGQAKARGELHGYIPPEVWRVLLNCAAFVEGNGSPTVATIGDFAFQGLASLLQDMSQKNMPFDDTYDSEIKVGVVDVVCKGRHAEWCRNFFSGLGETYIKAFEDRMNLRYEALKDQLDNLPLATPAQERVEPVVVGKPFQQVTSLSREIDSVLRDQRVSIQKRTDKAYEIFHSNVESQRITPFLPVLGRLIQSCGRLSQLERVREVYTVAQSIITNLKGQMADSKRKEMWVNIEDSMIIALAHAGDIEGAHVHRRRILEHLGEAGPSADAYGALILHVKDTTDDATNALMLWNEAMAVGVQPNLYLYNNIISKLSRARKADNALELFHQMRAQQIVPSSITYGAVIGACARVGDVISAETLFQEMCSQTNFKPRVPPFNTMMQVYTTTKPNRERAVWFYEEMQRRGVAPTAHTYKLLLDAYGSLEPTDITSMENVFEQLKADSHVALQGTHFASLINAYGCVCKDIDQAIAVFDSVPTYGEGLRDAVVYEAIVNALVANRRTDLIPAFMERMVADGVHMTAYVANFLIKGYANVGDIGQARIVFESMQDPPTGIAAPNNHAPHDPSVSAPIGVMEPVYREPSTWEAMIRAELGVGNRDRAYELLERLRARQYPEAVFNRISGVMANSSIPVF